jgi:pyruvate,orthophosphate dikinase
VNAETAADAKKGKEFGAEGIGLCRTERILREEHKKLLGEIVTGDDIAAPMAKLGDLLAADFAAVFQALDNQPVVVRLLDASPQAFAPDFLALVDEVTTLKTRRDFGKPIDEKVFAEKSALLEKVRKVREPNPAIGARGVRSGFLIPGFLRMQLKAIIEGACIALEKGGKPEPAILIPVISTVLEAARLRAEFDEVKEQVLKQRGKTLAIKLGALIEVPRVVFVAKEITKYVDFVTFGTTDLTQLGFGFATQDAEAQFLSTYSERGIFPVSPFTSLDTEGIGKLIQIAIAGLKEGKPQIEIGFIGAPSSDPASITFASTAGVSYVSCPPSYVPIARLAAAQSAVKAKGAK